MLCFALCGDGIRRFARLADADSERFRIKDRIAITKFATVVHFYWHTGEPFDHEFPGKAGVPACAAGDDTNFFEGAKLLVGESEIAKVDLARVAGDAAQK